MRDLFENKWIGAVLRIALGLIFVWAGVPKLLDPQAFAEIVAGYRLLPSGLIHLAALWLPWIETTAGLLLIFGVMTRGSALIVDILLVVFIIALCVNLIRGVDIHCGCFSLTPGTRHGMLGYIFRDIAILLLGLGVLALENRRHAQKLDGLYG